MKKKTIDKKPLYAAVGLILAAVVILLILLGGGSGKKSEPDPDWISLGEELYLVKVDRYSGMYLEDGSDTIVQDIMAITVVNNGEEAVQLGNVEVRSAQGQVYSFEFTTLFPGEQMVVLERNRAAYDPALEVAYAGVTMVARFQQAPELHEDVLEVSCADQAITVKNVSGETFNGGRVFYKNVSGDLLIGGITYMATVPALTEDEEVTLFAGHYTVDGSRLMFVTYAE